MEWDRFMEIIIVVHFVIDAKCNMNFMIIKARNYIVTIKGIVKGENKQE